jgi:hypothetical protein
MAWEKTAAAREQDDQSAEARALSQLEQALYQEGRDREAYEIGSQAIALGRRCPDGREILQSRFEAWMRLGARLEELEEAAAGSDGSYARDHNLSLTEPAGGSATRQTARATAPQGLRSSRPFSAGRLVGQLYLSPGEAP